ncbi:nitroreductase/quinone reductase family protein [Lacisediminihabitans changchengi]|uniref:Nitroreductase family deazaflavin-dependent oxidoreductase n=1 Tax=Lacisediminihabitans changchengi TaxID=2787634 RepID=A0A934W2C5_9MICO|nr:nitroreductase/quinone reductase family protein [Lacisediminihabitans changchengi]MBK4346039.1 nitroreductase family deazaflavin-dependent oxidoreductase [Lacisediminihabitans changchengi]
MSNWNDSVITEFRANNGVVGGPFAGAHLLLLTTTGAKTGEPRVSPVMPSVRDGRLYIVASKAGADTSPAWFHNLVAHPEVFVELATDDGVETYDARAVVLDRSERDRIYASIAATNPAFAGYQEKTDRVIPVVELVRR